MEKIQVKVNIQGQPIAFQWKRKQHRIEEIVDEWREVGQWWLKEPELYVYRVLSHTGGLYELHFAQNTWGLAQIFD